MSTGGPPPLPPTDTLHHGSDARYLMQTVGPALTKALCDIHLKRPQDPIDYLGRFLAGYDERMAFAAEARTDTREKTFGEEDVKKMKEGFKGGKKWESVGETLAEGGVGRT
ncbi:hypothetical protein HK104_006754 [Borealophlyctis nickersoniae]|nr:hypothetical protein HK104_006754 [Borealophlyctis nickersoniae]